MTTRLDTLRIVDPVLTNLARGYVNPAFVSEVIMPTVMVKKEAGWVPQFGKEAFKTYNTERAANGGTNIMVPENISTISFNLTEHDLSYPMDYREIQEAGFPLEEYAVKTVSDIIGLRHEIAVATLCQNTANFGSNYATLTGNHQWNVVHADSDPIVDIAAGKEAIRASIGIEPNVLILGPDAFNALAVHPTIIERLKYTQTGVVTTDDLAKIFQIDQVVVGKAVKSSDANVMSDVWGDVAVLAYVAKPLPDGTRSQYQPSFGYTLRKEGQPIVDKWNSPDGKITYARTTDLLTEKILGAEAAYLINDVCA